MSIWIDEIYGSLLGSTYPGDSAMTLSLRDNLRDGLDSLLLKFSDLLGGISERVIFTTYFEGNTEPSTGVWFPSAAQPTWFANLETHLASSWVPYDKTKDIIILLMPNEINRLEAGTYRTAAPSGAGTVVFDHERLMFHELIHALTLQDPLTFDAFLRGNYSLASPWEADTIALAAENIIYRPATPGAAVAGAHDGVDAPGGFAAISAFDALSGEAGLQMTTFDDALAAVFSETDDGFTARKIIFERGVNPEGFDTTKLNHYILNEIESSEAPLIDNEGALAGLLDTSIDDDSASSNIVDKVKKTRETLDDLQSFSEARSSLKFVPSELESVLAALPELDQTRARLISIETSSSNTGAFAQVVGPQKAVEATTANAGDSLYLSIAAGESAALLVGGAGFHELNVDFRNRLDDLYGSTEDDFIVGADGLATGDERSILDGREGNDVLVTGSGRAHVKAGADNDIILAGSGNTKIDGDKDSTDKGTDIFAFLDRSTVATIDLTNEIDGYGLATQGSAEVRIKGVEVFLGTDALTTFKGSGKGNGSTFIAGTGGGDFTLRAGDKAYGHAGVQDIFRFFTTKDDGVKSDESALDYLERNKVYVGNFAAADGDEVWVNGVKFNGNKVTTALWGEMIAPDWNRDDPHNAYVLTGNSTYGTAFANPTFEVRGASYFGEPWGALSYADMQYRDVNYAATSDGLGIFNFFARGITGVESGGSSASAGQTGYRFNALTATDEQLMVVIDGFQNGMGGISFENDGLANFRPGVPDSAGDDGNWPHTQNFATNWGEESIVGVSDEEDIFDGNVDGQMSPGGASVTPDDPRFNLGNLAFGGDSVDWDAALSGPQTIEGSSDADTLDGGWANDEIAGGDGDDIIYGGPGDDILDGGAGNDEIHGGGGNDTLLGGTGDDRLYGDEGSNILDGGDGDDIAYVEGYASDFRIYRKPDGTAVAEYLYGEGNIQTFTNVEMLTFYEGSFAPDVLPMGTAGNDVLLGSPGADLLDGGTGDDELAAGEGDDIYVIDSAGDVVTENVDEGIDTVRTTLAAYALGANVENLEFTGTGGFSGTGNDLDNLITGGAGNDTLTGGAGYDRFRGLGGTDTIDGGDDEDTLVLTGKPGDYAYSIDGLGVVTVTDGTNSIALTDVEYIQFAGGAGYEISELVAKFVTGTPGNDALLEGDSSSNVIRGLAGDDNLRGGEGSDLLDGGDGLDTAYYSGNSSDYIIYFDPSAGLSVSDQAGSDGTDFLSGVEALHFDGDNVTIDVSALPPLGIAGNDIIAGSGRPDRLYGMAGNDDLQGANGADVLYGGAGNDTLDGGGGNDVLEGGAGNDVNIFGTGNDLAWDTAGDDSYVYAAGDGDDRIRDDGGTDAIILGSSITPADVTFSIDDEDIIMHFAGGGSLTLHYGLVEGNEIEEIRFADSTVWNPAVRLQTPTSGNDNLVGTKLADTISGGAGNDTIEGRQGNDTLAGDTGSDVLSGGAGDDTYLFASGDGVDVIQDDSSNYNFGSGGNDTLIFGTGIAPIDVQVSMANTRDIVLTITGTGDQVTLRDSARYAMDSIETVLFADSTVWIHADLMAKILVSTSGNDTLYGSYAAETISGGAGNDYIDAREGDDIITGGTGNDNITGGAGNDTYYFNLGDGQDYISDYTNDVATSLDKVVFGAGILPSDIIVSQADNGWDLVLSIAGTTDKITINDAAFATGYRIEQIRFADSTVWTHSDLMTKAYGPRSTGDSYWGTSGVDAISGGAGNDVIRASGGNDTLAGGTGNDTLYGDAGTDTVLLMGLSPTYSMVTSGGFLNVTDNAPTVDDNDGTDQLKGIEKLRFSDNQEVGIVSPIILDLDGRGVTTVPAYVGRARYDMDGDGIADITSWMGRGEGMLFLDRDANGTLSNAGEFSFVNDVEGAASDLVGLRAFDSNGDGTLSSGDGRFADFRIWRDGNGDGGVQNGEIMTLAEAGVASLNLLGQAVEGNTALGDVAVLNTGSYTRTDGQTAQFIDAALTYFSGAAPSNVSGAPRQQYRPLSRRQLDVMGWDERRTLRQIVDADWPVAHDPGAGRPRHGDQRMWSGPAVVAIDHPTQSVAGSLSEAAFGSFIDHRVAMMVQEMSVFGAKSAGEGLSHWQRENMQPMDFFA